MPQLAFFTTAALITFVTATPLFGWVGNARTRRLRAQLNAARVASDPRVINLAALESLPPPVQRYLRQALPRERGVIESVRAQH